MSNNFNTEVVLTIIILVAFVAFVAFLLFMVGVPLFRMWREEQELARPPPSYTRLFPEEQPPAYHDEIVLKERK